MKKMIVKLVILVSLAAIGLVVYSSLHKKREQPLKARNIDEMLALPDEQIEVGLGTLLTAREYDPDLDVRKYLATLDKMAAKLRTRIGNEKDPRKVITIMNRYIFTECGYTPPNPDEDAPAGGFLSNWMDRKEACARLYLALGERVGLPLFAVAVPKHVFVRYVSGNTRINIDPEENGASISDGDYVSRYRVPNTPLARSFYLRELTEREVLGVSLHSLGIAHREAGRNADAIQAYRRALAIIPNSAETWCSLAPPLGKIGRLDEAVSALRKALEINPVFPEAWFNLALTAYDKRDYRYAWSCIHKCEQLGYKPNPGFLEALSAKMRDPGT